MKTITLSYVYIVLSNIAIINHHKTQSQMALQVIGVVDVVESPMLMYPPP